MGYFVMVLLNMTLCALSETCFLWIPRQLTLADFTEYNTYFSAFWLAGKVPVPDNGWILGNIDYGGFYRVNYEPDMWNQLGRQLSNDHTVFSLANRAGLIGDAFNLAR